MAEDKIDIGNFDKMITLLSPSRKKSSEGATSLTWQPEKKVYAMIEESATDENLDDNMNIVSNLTIKATLYNIHNLSNRWRLTYNDGNYEILSVNPVRNTPFCIIKAYKIIE